MNKVSIVAGAAAVAMMTSAAAAEVIVIDTFDFTAQPSQSGALGVDFVSLVFPTRSSDPVTGLPVPVFFDIEAVTPIGETPPIGGWRGLNVEVGSGTTFLSVERRADLPGIDPNDRPGVIGFQTGVFLPPPGQNFQARATWAGEIVGGTATPNLGVVGGVPQGLNLSLTSQPGPDDRFELETFAVDQIGGQVDVTILVTDTQGNVSSLTRTGFEPSQVFVYNLIDFVPDPDAGTGELADLTDIFSLEVLFETPDPAADLTFDIATLRVVLVAEPISLAGFGLGLALVGLAIRRRA